MPIRTDAHYEIGVPSLPVNTNVTLKLVRPELVFCDGSRNLMPMGRSASRIWVILLSALAADAGRPATVTTADFEGERLRLAHRQGQNIKAGG